MAQVPFPFVDVAGDHRDIGVQFGQAAAEGIRCFLELIVRDAAAARQWTRAETLQHALAFLPVFRQHCPQLLAEIEGLAAGARISFAEALLLQVRGEVAHVGTGCSAFALSRAVTADGRALAGQNSDMAPEMQELGLVLRIRPAAGPRLLLFTFPGLLGYHGLNSHGVAHFANALPARPWRLALPHYPLKRLALATASVAESLGLMARVPVCSTGNYVLADGQGNIGDAELAPAGLTRWDGEGGWVVHTNHILAAAEPGDVALPDHAESVHRYERLRELVRARLGSLDVAAMQAILSDHAGYPTSLCRHAEAAGSAKTIASLIAEPERGLLHVAVGNPCQHEYSTYSL